MSEEEEDFINYGSPLEVLNEDNIHSQKVPRLEDQIVTDKNGKRRFHGAFSGGFSAGYFNSVGSKDGWTPSTFVSSSSKRSSQTLSSNDPRHYMDEEDLNDHGIAPQRIQATTSYDAENQKKRKREDENVGPIPGQPVLEELLQPSRDTIGQQLLKKLGWRPGQGIGPRVSKKEKHLAERESKKIWKASLSFAINDSHSDSDEDASEYSSFKFAPSDIEALCVNPKSNFFGLGYQPLNKTNPFGGKSSAYESNSRVSLEKSKGFFKGQAFGVGAFEEEDEDIYTKDNMQNYDFTLGCPEEFNQQKDKSTALGTCGIIAQLEGFKLSSKSHEKAKSFPLPVLPVSFKTWHQPRRRRFERKEEESRGLGRHELSIDDRKRIISDSTGATKVEIRSGVKGDNSCTQGKKNIERSPSPSNLPDANEDQKNVSRKPDLQYFSSFKPFSTNSEKQKRYDSYLKFKEKGLMEQFHCMQPKSMTDWEKNQERMEFQRAASIYRPLTSTMASRFTSGNFEESILDFNKSTKGATKPTDVLNVSEVDDRMKAAKTKMFGQLTQSVCEWRPVKTLSKRFNVPSLFSESSSVGVSSKKVNLLASCSFLPDSIAKISEFENSKEEEENVDAIQVDSLNESFTISSQTSMDEDRRNSTEILDSETYGLKVPVSGPPTMDLFKAIFQDSDSDSDENDKQLISNLEAEKYKNKSQLKRPSRFDKPKESFDAELTNFLFNAKNENIPQTENITLAQAKGVFKNVDFYAINQYRNESTNKEENCSFANKDWTSEIEKKKDSDNDDSDNSDSEEEYGPIVPPNFIQTKSSASDCSKSSSVSVVINDNYLQNVSVKKEKKSKHKNKDKHKHKKSKKKKQKDKRDHRKSKHR